MARKDGELIFDEGGPEELTPYQRQRRMLATLLGASAVLGPSAFILGTMFGGDNGRADQEVQQRQRELVEKSVARAKDVAQVLAAFLDGDVATQQVMFERDVTAQQQKVTESLFQSVTAGASLADTVTSVADQLNNFNTLNQQLFGYMLLAPLIEDEYRQQNSTHALASLSFTDGLVKTAYASALTVQQEPAHIEFELGDIRQELARFEGRRMVIIPQDIPLRDQVQIGVSSMLNKVLRPAMKR